MIAALVPFWFRIQSQTMRVVIDAETRAPSLVRVIIETDVTHTLPPDAHHPDPRVRRKHATERLAAKIGVTACGLEFVQAAAVVYENDRKPMCAKCAAAIASAKKAHEIASSSLRKALDDAIAKAKSKAAPP
jgi:hypothetical protein